MKASQGNASLELRLLGFVRQHVDEAKIQAPSSRSKHGDTCPLVATVVLGGVARNGVIRWQIDTADLCSSTDCQSVQNVGSFKLWIQ
jgi:hypothetical protein